MKNNVISESYEEKTRDATKSYVIGFIASIVFTIIPYTLVTNGIIEGNRLLGAILTIAVLQMMVQVLFFLHLGRGPKPLYNIFFFAMTIVIILMTVIGSIFIMDNLHYNMAPKEVVKKLAQDENISQLNGELTGACTEIGVRHKISIVDGKAIPSFIQAKRCDSITFINEDDKNRTIMFGDYPNHSSYGGETEKTVLKGRPKTITLNTVGTFKYHDHEDPKLRGSFTVQE